MTTTLEDPAVTQCRDCGEKVSLQARTCPHCGAPFPYLEKWDGYGFEYKSPQKLFGLPLVHVSFKYRKSGRPVIAHGIIAIGQYGFGMITIAQFGIGVVCLGQFSLAAACISQFALAAFAICQIGAIFDGFGQIIIHLDDFI